MLWVIFPISEQEAVHTHDDLITVAEHGYVIENDMYAVFYPYSVAMLCYPVGGYQSVYGENQNGPLGFDSA